MYLSLFDNVFCGFTMAAGMVFISLGLSLYVGIVSLKYFRFWFSCIVGLLVFVLTMTIWHYFGCRIVNAISFLVGARNESLLMFLVGFLLIGLAVFAFLGTNKTYSSRTLLEDV